MSRWRLEIPEALAVLLGAWMRLAGFANYYPRWGYDFVHHWHYIQALATRHVLPPASEGVSTYHPPLYYLLASLVAGQDNIEAVQAISIVAGIARLVVLWIGLRVMLPEDRLARTVALALAAILPCAVHLDLMVTNEALHCLLTTGALLLFVLVLRSQGRRRVWWGAALGATLALALLTKVSSVMLLGIMGLAYALQLIRQKSPWRERVRQTAPLGIALALAVALAAPFYFMRRRESGHVFLVTAFEGMHGSRAEFLDTPYWKRQPPTYAFGWGDAEFLRLPCYPNDLHRFWPVLLASTFGDYYNFWFSGYVDSAAPARMINGHPMSEATIPLLRASVWAGIPIAAAVVVAFIVAIRRAWRTRNAELGALLLAPALATLAQAHLGIKYPWEDAGIIKGHFIQFVAAPLFGLFGMAVGWLWRRPRARVAAVALCASVAVVAAYTMDARTGWFR